MGRWADTSGVSPPPRVQSGPRSIRSSARVCDDQKKFCSNPRRRDRAPGGAPAGFHELESDQRHAAEAGEKENARDVAAGLLLGRAKEHAENKTADAPAAADEAGHHADILREAL